MIQTLKDIIEFLFWFVIGSLLLKILFEVIIIPIIAKKRKKILLTKEQSKMIDELVKELLKKDK